MLRDDPAAPGVVLSYVGSSPWSFHGMRVVPLSLDLWGWSSQASCPFAPVVCCCQCVIPTITQRTSIFALTNFYCRRNRLHQLIVAALLWTSLFVLATFDLPHHHSLGLWLAHFILDLLVYAAGFYTGMLMLSHVIQILTCCSGFVSGAGWRACWREIWELCVSTHPYLSAFHPWLNLIKVS